MALRVRGWSGKASDCASVAQPSKNSRAAAAALAKLFRCASSAATPRRRGRSASRNAIASYVAQRDEIMNQLATADPQVRERLASMYLVMDGVLARRE